MDEVVILHNPRCSKSRETLALLHARKLQPRIVDYLAEPPSVVEIERILGKLDLPPRALMRNSEPEYSQLDLDNPSLSRAELVHAMHEHPRLIQRPISWH